MRTKEIKKKYTFLQVLAMISIIFFFAPFIFLCSGYLLIPLVALVDIIFKPSNGDAYKVAIFFGIFRFLIGAIISIVLSYYLWPKRLIKGK